MYLDANVFARKCFELVMYFVGDSHDEQTALARTRTEHWVEVGALNTTQLAKRIDADRCCVCPARCFAMRPRTITPSSNTMPKQPSVFEGAAVTWR
jgi:hypothetical protein